MSDQYDQLRNATPEQLLAAVKWFYLDNETDSSLYDLKKAMIEIGFAVGQPGGWKQVAPLWLEQVLREDPFGYEYPETCPGTTR